MSILQRFARLAPLTAALTLSLALPAAAQPAKLRLAHAGSETDSQHVATWSSQNA